MADVFTQQRRSELMRGIRSKNTKPELIIRKNLHKMGYRYRLHDNKLPGKPDIVFSKMKVLIQIRGCFWHGHDCIDGHLPKSNKNYWSEKLESNRLRDLRNDAELNKLGWNVIIVWECSCRNQKLLEKEISRITSILEISKQGHRLK